MRTSPYSERNGKSLEILNGGVDMLMLTQRVLLATALILSCGRRGSKMNLLSNQKTTEIISVRSVLAGTRVTL